jgi:hypothetical protein
MVSPTQTQTLAVTMTTHLTCFRLFLLVGSRGLMRRQTSLFVDLLLDIAVVRFRGYPKLYAFIAIGYTATLPLLRSLTPILTLTLTLTS